MIESRSRITRLCGGLPLPFSDATLDTLAQARENIIPSRIRIGTQYARPLGPFKSFTVHPVMNGSRIAKDKTVLSDDHRE